MATAPVPAPLIPRVPVTSSNLRSVGYDLESRTLAIEFQGTGDVYHFEGVPPDITEQLLGARSKGTFFYTVIRGKFRASRVHAPRTGKCPKCGDLGLDGCRCDDCGCADYLAEEFDRDGKD
jgi:hypothetical protein